MYQKYFKRTFDTTVSIIVLMLALPIGIIVALVIKLDSRGPAIFKQKRTGRHGKVFSMYKFRTMTSDNNVHDTKESNRITTMGKIIRALSLDEIPQFVNVIKGEMSFIGPRPWIPEYYDNMTNKQRQRNSVRPGITGLAQARGRNNLSVLEKINLDLLYIKNVTFTNDVKIVVLTVLALFEKTGAAIEKHGIHQEINELRLQHSEVSADTDTVFFEKLPTTEKAKDRISRNAKKDPKSNSQPDHDEKFAEVSNNKQMKTRYSVLMSVYIKEDPKFLQESIDSILAQTIPPNEILILEDGPLTPQLKETLELYKIKNKSIKTISYEVNRGLGPVLADGVILAKNTLIARMDSDDIADPNRCEMQLDCFNKNPDLDIVGCNVTEFMDSTENIVAHRNMPEHQDVIVDFSRKRNPFAHPSVMFKKASVMNAGNYRDYKLCEDYDLWVRMIQNGAKCHNIQDYLVNMRLSPDFYARRGGLTYVRRIFRFKRELLSSGHYSRKDFFVSATSTAVVGLMPNQVRAVLYSRFLRRHKTISEEQ